MTASDFITLCTATLAISLTAAAAPLPNAFFAMDTGTKDASHATASTQAEMLKELGYAGIGYTGFDDITGVLKELDARNLRMFTVYLSAEVNADGYSYDPKMKEGIEALKGRDAMLWLTISSKTLPVSSTDGDANAVKMLREIADMAEPAGLRIALYPHTGCWLERVEDAVRLAGKTQRKSVGVTFNLCHWLNAGKGQNMKPLIDLAIPRLFVVTINGADTEGGWDRLIQTLDRGSFDVAGFLAALKQAGYKGPVGLQGYGIKGDVHENLKRSIEAWRKLSASE